MTTSTQIRFHNVLLGALCAWLVVAAACGAESKPTPPPTAAQTPTASPTAAATPAPPTPTPLPTPTPVPPTPTPRPTPTPAPSPSLRGASPPEEIDAGVLLARSSEAMSEVESFHFDVSGVFHTASEQASIQVPLSFVGDVQAPDRTHGVITLSVAVFALEMEIIIADGVTYTTNPQTGSWQVSEEGGLGIPDPAGLLAGGEPPLSDARYEGTERRNGIELHRLIGTARLDMVEGLGRTTEATIWIGADDLLLHEVSLETEMSLDALGLQVGGGVLVGEGEIDLTIRLSDFNGPVDIRPPPGL